MANSLELLQKNFAVVHAASSELLPIITSGDLTRDIKITAELSGLMMLRQSTTDLSKFPSGAGILGAVPAEEGSAIMSFVVAYAGQNGLNVPRPNVAALSDADKLYIPEISQFERKTIELCARHQVDVALFQYVAAAASVKLILAGTQLKMLDAATGLALTLYHIVAASKTVPYPGAAA